MIELLEEAVAQSYISAPGFPFLPEDFPFRLAVCSVSPTEGCEPPSMGKLRLGVGVGQTNEIAAFTAMCEAVERFSLQFDATAHSVMSPTLTWNGDAADVPLKKLSLGAPGAQTSSKGCAAGESFDDAVDRAALEAIEHLILDRFRSGTVATIGINPAQIETVCDVNAYLAPRLRKLKLEALIGRQGYVVVRAICCDHDGGRPTIGSAADLNVVEACIRATDEAVVSWRNMIELERNGIAADPNSSSSLLHVYRGAVSNEYDREPELLNSSDLVVPKTTARPIEILTQIVKARVRVFDMCHAQIGLPVVRVILG